MVAQRRDVDARRCGSLQDGLAWLEADVPAIDGDAGGRRLRGGLRLMHYFHHCCSACSGAVPYGDHGGVQGGTGRRRRQLGGRLGGVDGRGAAQRGARGAEAGALGQLGRVLVDVADACLLGGVHDVLARPDNDGASVDGDDYIGVGLGRGALGRCRLVLGSAVRVVGGSGMVVQPPHRAEGSTVRLVEIVAAHADACKGRCLQDCLTWLDADLAAVDDDGTSLCCQIQPEIMMVGVYM